MIEQRESSLLIDEKTWITVISYAIKNEVTAMQKTDLFPGGNTTHGFFSYYDQILPQKDANMIYCVKGGPGAGKSTFFKTLGKEFLEMGCDVEFLHCSSDNHSLDGILIKQYRTLLVDGTAPHIVDPKNPGASDIILHFGDFFNMAKLKEQKDTILSLNKAIGQKFSRAYRYLRSAKEIYLDINNMYQNAFLHTNLKAISSNLNREIFADKKGKEEKERKMFLSAVTPGGLVNYLKETIQTPIVYQIKSHAGDCAPKLLESIRNEALKRDFSIETFYCPMDPDQKIDHLIIKELGVSIVTSNQYHPYEGGNVIDLATCYAEPDKAEIRYNMEWMDTLIQKSVSVIREAKALHDELEQCYVPNIDFEQINLLKDTVKEEILANK